MSYSYTLPITIKVNHLNQNAYNRSSWQRKSKNLQKTLSGNSKPLAILGIWFFTSTKEACPNSNAAIMSNSTPILAANSHGVYPACPRRRLIRRPNRSNGVSRIASGSVIAFILFDCIICVE